MTNINPINLNLSGINNTIPAQENTSSRTETNTNAENAGVKTKNLSEKEIFAFMDNAALLAIVGTKLSPTALVNKYNSPEAIARIEEMMGSFENAVVDGLQEFEEEFGTIPEFQNLSEADKLALAALYTLEQ